MKLQARLNRLDKLIAEDRIVRGTWTGVADGKKTACLLAALSPESGEQQTATACPSDVMPVWLAHLTPSMDDSGSIEAWPAFIRREH